MKGLKKATLLLSVFVFFSVPASTNFQLKSYEFGGGSGTSDSTNYSTEGVVNDVGGQQSSTGYSLNGGMVFVQQANVPIAPTFQNTASWYNKLQFIINVSGNPSDAKYAIAISTDNFATTNYIQSDNTVGATLGTEDFQTYTDWGGASGEYVIGLVPNTTYYIKAKATQGRYTESSWGPVAAASTSQSTLSFDIDVSASDTETPAPYSIVMGELGIGSITTASQKIWIDIDTNAAAGGYVYLYDQYAGLRSSHSNYTISSATADLSGVNEGFGLQSASTAQSAGGPLVALSPYNGVSENVGVVNPTVNEVFHTSSSPITAGRASLIVKAKVSNFTPSSTDYSDTLTFIASSIF